MKTRKQQLEEFLFSLYDLCERKPDSVEFHVIGEWVFERDQEFDRKNTIPFSQELKRMGLVGIPTMGSVELLPAGIHAVEKAMAYDRAEREKAVNFGPDIPTTEEVRMFLTAACEEVDFNLAVEFNCIVVGEKLGFSPKKIDRCRQRTKADGFIHEPNLGTQSNTRSQITTKTLSLVMGLIDEREGAITLNDNTDNSTNLTVGGNMIGSNVAQNSAGAAQALTFTAGQKLDFQNFIELARTNIDDLGLSDTDRTELSNSLDILESSLEGDLAPDPDVLKKELTTTQRLIESATGSAVGGMVAEHFPTLFSYLPI